MPRSSVNFSRGRILPRATPVRSGTRHSISVTRLLVEPLFEVGEGGDGFGLMGSFVEGGAAGGLRPGAQGGRPVGDAGAAAGLTDAGRGVLPASGGRPRRRRVSMRIETALPAACHSGCHWTHSVKPLALLDGEGLDDAVGRARLDAQAVAPSRLTAWPCTELTSKRGRPTTRSSTPPGSTSTSCAGPYCTPTGCVVVGAVVRPCRRPRAPPGAASRRAPRWSPACRGRS